MKKEMMKLIVTDDPLIGDSSVRLDGRLLAWGYSSAQDAIGACAEELTAVGINVPKIWDILEEDWDPTSSLTWYEAVVEKKIEAVEYCLFAHWANALINDDFCGMSEDEAAELNEWIERENPGRCLGCSDEGYFSRSNDASRLAGDCLDYQFTKF